MRYLTNVEGGSSKFWEGRVEGDSLVVRFGKLGTDGQTKTKALGSAAKAEAELAKVAAEKLRKGYVEGARQKARAKAEGASAKGVGAKGKPVLVAIEADAFPPDAEVPAMMASLFAPGTPVTVLPAAGGILALGVKPDSLGQESVLLFAASASDEPRALKLPTGNYAWLAVAPAGDRVVVVELQKGALYELELPDGDAVEVFTDPVPAAACGAGYVDADHLAYLTDDGLVLLERDGAVLKQTARRKNDRLTGLATAHGAIILAGRDGKLRVLSPAAGKLKERATLITSARVLVGDAGRVYLTDHRFANRRTTYFELVGLA